MAQRPLSSESSQDKADIAAFTRYNSSYYQYKWLYARGLGFWNWSAFVLGPFWFAYRKQYGWSIFFALAYVLFDFYLTSNPFHLAVSIELMVFAGLVANLVYQESFLKVRRVAEQASPEEGLVFLAQQGSVNWKAPLGVLAGMVLCMLLLPSVLNIQLFNTSIRKIEVNSMLATLFKPEIRLQELNLLRQDYQRAYFQGQFQRASTLAENSIRLARLKLENENPFIISLQTDLLEFKLKAGNYQDALELTNRLLRDYQSRYGQDHLFPLMIMNQQVSNYIYQGRFDKARPIANNCLIALGKYPDNLKQPAILNNLALIYSNLGSVNQAFCQYDQAEKYQVEALNLALKASRGYTLFSCHFLERMGDYYKEVSKLDQAEVFYSQARDIAEQVLGRDNPLVSSIFLKLGEIEIINKQWSQAKELTAHAYAVNKKYYGESHVATAAAACQLGHIYFAQGMFHDAEQKLDQALEITKRAIGEDNAVYAAQLIRRTDLYIFQNNLIAAENALAKTIELFETVYGHNNPMLLIPLEQLVLLYEIKENPILTKATQRRIETITKDSTWHPSTEDTYRLQLDDIML